MWTGFLQVSLAMISPGSPRGPGARPRLRITWRGRGREARGGRGGALALRPPRARSWRQVGSMKVGSGSELVLETSHGRALRGGARRRGEEIAPVVGSR